MKVGYDRNHYFGLGPIPKQKYKLADTFGRYHNSQNHIAKKESSQLQYGVFFFLHKRPKKQNLMTNHDKQSSHFSTAKKIEVKATFFFM